MTEPVAQGFLPAEDGHEVAWYEFGNPDGLPVLFLHGGPGSGFKPDYLPFFPLDRVRFISFDQRGAGLSRPFAKLEDNTTPKLLSDIERLRKAHGIESWIVVGHSWGSTLAVIYAKAHPAVCRKVLLVSFFGGQPQDQRWTFEDIRIFFPEEVAALHALKDGDKRPFGEWVCAALAGAQKDEVAFRLSCLTSAAARMNPKPVTRADITAESVGRWQMLMHYGLHDFFMPVGSIYENLSALTMPVHALHGRFDMDCPISQAFQLKEALPSLKLTVVSGNHSTSEEPMGSAFKALADEVCR